MILKTIMDKLKALKLYFTKLIQRINRYPSQLHQSRDQYIEYDLDGMIINNPRDVFSYFAFEYTISFSFNLINAVVTIIFLMIETSESNLLFKYWLRLGYILNIISLLPKLIILLKVYYIPQYSDSLIVRRLMMLIRTNVFSWNVKMTYILYIYYIVMLGKLATTNTCESMQSNSYRLCHFILCNFLLRLVNLFVRFFYQWCFSGTADESSKIKGAQQEEIDEIPEEVFTEETIGSNNEHQWCGICLLNFKSGQKIKRLPCSKKHFFHKYCTEIWLSKRNVCPYCRRELVYPKSN